MNRYLIRQFIRQSPILYGWKIQLLNRERLEGLASSKTEIVIEGFPRSANTFAHVAFTQAQKKHIHAAHHLHTPSQIIYAHRHQLPCIVLIRDPLDAITSLSVFDPESKPNQMLMDYLHFYQRITPLRAGYVVAPFEITTTDFGRVVKALNKKFRTSYVPFNHTEENRKKVYDIIKGSYPLLGTDNTNKLSIPDDKKKKLQRARMETIHAALDETFLETAKVLYRQFLEFANNDLN